MRTYFDVATGKTVTVATDLEPAPTAEQIALGEAVLMKRQGEQLAEALIQAQVEAYNAAHGLSFRDVYSCDIYADKTGYPHQQFCADITDWNWRVWSATRATQADILAGNRTIPTEAEFIAELPIYTGVK